MTHLWLLVLVFPYVFVVTASLRLVLINIHDRYPAWWAFPLFMAVFCPLFIAGLLGLVLLIAFAVVPA